MGVRCFSPVKYSQGQATGSFMGGNADREVRIGVNCENGLGRLVFIDIACSNAGETLDFIASNMLMIVNWQAWARKRSWPNLSNSPCIYMI